jgi:hypothetical protein
VIAAAARVDHQFRSLAPTWEFRRERSRPQRASTNQFRSLAPTWEFRAGRPSFVHDRLALHIVRRRRPIRFVIYVG